MNNNTDKYKKIQCINESSGCTIYLATRTLTGEQVILKKSNTTLLNLSNQSKLKNEFRILKKIQSDYVVKPLDYIITGENFFLVLEYCEGLTLAEYMKHHQITLKEFLYLTITIASGLMAIHSSDVIHKGLNPSHIIYNPKLRTIKFIDFAIATEFSYEKPVELSPNSFEGILAYIAPEQTGRLNRFIDYRTDFYSLGITFYEMLCNKLPFVTDSPTELIYSHIAKVPQTVHEVNPTIPKVVSDIISKLISKIPEDRYKSAKGLIHDLNTCLSHLTNDGDIEMFELGSSDQADQLEISKIIYDRKQDYTRLTNSFSFILSNNKKLVTISGNPGVGKTSLVNELHKPVLNANGIFISGKLDQFQKNIPYSALSQAVNQFLSYVICEPEVILKEWQATLTEACNPYGKIFTDKLPLLKLLIGEQPELPDLSPLEERLASMHLIQNLMMAMASYKHPLVLFIDDVHLADIGSLEVIVEAFRNEHLKHILIIICYRENEVDEDHPLAISLGKIEKEGGNIEKIHLPSLSIDAINQMLIDTLHREQIECHALAKLVYDKTQGNPFHIKQFLKHCHTEGLICFDYQNMYWTWNQSAIQKSPFQDNVIDFLIQNMMAFPKVTLEALSIGACIGQNFNLEMLSQISGYDENELLLLLKLPVTAEIIYSLQNYANQIEFQFAHDRFEFACYSLLAEDKKRQIHYQIATYYEKKALNIGISGKERFLIADNYCKAINIIELPDEKRKVADILLKASHAASLVSSFDSAKIFLEEIINPLISDSLDDHFMFTVYTEYHSILFALAEYERGDVIYAKLIKLNNDPMDLADSTCQQISSLSNRGKYKNAFMLGIIQLEKFGIYFPEDNLEEVVRYESDAYYADSRRLDFQDIDAYKKGDAKEKVIAKLIASINPASYLLNPLNNLWASIINAKRILDYGHTLEGLSTLSSLMIGWIVLKNDYRVGYDTTLKVMHYMEKHHVKKEIYGIYLKFALSCNHWFEDVQTNIPYAREGFIGNVEYKDIEYACYSHYVTQSAILETCNSIEELHNETKVAISFAQKTGNDHSVDCFLSYRQLYRALKGETISEGSFNDAQYSEQSRHEDMSKNGCYFLTLRALSAVIYSDFDTAFILTEKAVQILSFVPGLYLVAQHNFLHSLAICKRIESSVCSTEERIALGNQLNTNQLWLKARSADAPVNFAHLYHGIEAEIQFIEGNYFEANKLFELSVDEAAVNKRPYHYALLCELAAMAFIKMNINRTAVVYLKEAYLSYLSLEAFGKVDQMKRSYDAFLFTDLNLPQNKNTPNPVSVDLNSVMQAAHAIAGEMLLESILEKLVHVLLENSGAQNVYFLAKKSGQYEIQVESHSEGNITKILEGHIAKSDSIPIRVVNYVERTHEDIVLENALESVPYGDDEYIIKNQCKSIVCTPVLNKGELKGVLYLENNLIISAFGFEHLEILKVIASQLAISLENAYLYNNLRELVEERTLELRDEISERKKAEKQLENMANHDHLTGLPNRKMFMETLEQSVDLSIRNKTLLFILFIDLDGFKLVNDNYGHDKGDLVLKTVARRLLTSVRSCDTVSRMGGDEFVAVIDNVLNLDEIHMISQRIITAIKEPIVLDKEGAFASVSASIGISALPYDGITAEELIRKADQAMYVAKKEGKSRFNFYAENYKI